jgi:hypothetical protein
MLLLTVLPETVKLARLIAPPTVISFLTPTPPVVINEPVSVEVEFIVLFSVI